jgi:hypothetical protein
MYKAKDQKGKEQSINFRELTLPSRFILAISISVPLFLKMSEINKKKYRIGGRINNQAKKNTIIVRLSCI